MATEIQGAKIVTEEIENAAGANPYSITLTAEQATTSNSSIIFGSIPAGTKRITIMLDAVSTSGSSPLILQLGDGGGIETTGYVGSLWQQNSAGSDGGVVVGDTNGLEVTATATAATGYTGQAIFSLENAGTFTWVGNSHMGNSPTRVMSLATTAKSLTAELTQISLTTAGGSDTFDAGVASIQFQ